MTGNAQKTPVYAKLKKAGLGFVASALQLTGKTLPASIVSISGSIATIKLELSNTGLTLPGSITVPVIGSEYIRLPLQQGCKGVVRPADARLGPVSGLGGTTADLTPPGNLSALVFEPIGNKNFAAPEDPNQLELYGVDGALIKSTVNKEWYARWTTSGVTISNLAGTASIDWNGAACEFKGPVVFDQVVTKMSGLQLSGTIESVTGGLYSGNIHTSGTITGDTDVIAGGKSGKTHVHEVLGSTGSDTSPPI